MDEITSIILNINPFGCSGIKTFPLCWIVLSLISSICSECDQEKGERRVKERLTDETCGIFELWDDVWVCFDALRMDGIGKDRLFDRYRNTRHDHHISVGERLLVEGKSEIRWINGAF